MKKEFKTEKEVFDFLKANPLKGIKEHIGCRLNFWKQDYDNVVSIIVKFQDEKVSEITEYWLFPFSDKDVPLTSLRYAYLDDDGKFVVESKFKYLKGDRWVFDV